MSESERQRAEERREAAEVGRSAQEDLRQIGEGGQKRVVVGEDHETGRVEAEEARVVSEDGRVNAEEKRADVRRFYAKLATYVALPIAFIALVPAIVGIVYLDRQAERTRAVVSENRAIIKRQAQAAKASRDINKRQAAALSYLCETTSVLSLVIGQLQLVDESFLSDPGLAETVKDKIRSRIRVYRVAQEEFARREPCQVIE